MPNQPLSYLNDLFQLIVLGAIVIYLFGHVNADERRAPIAFAAFAVTVFFMSTIYWVVHELMTRTDIYVFSAIDVVDVGINLLLAASLSTATERAGRLDVPAFVSAGIFAAANTGAWIMWNGSWFRDILSGASLWYLFYCIARAITQYRVFSRGEHLVIATCVVAAVILQIVSYTNTGSVRNMADYASYVAWALGDFIIIYRYLRLRKSDQGLDGALVCTFLLHIWNMCAMYLSLEPIYSVFEVAAVVSVVFLANAVVRKVESA